MAVIGTLQAGLDANHVPTLLALSGSGSTTWGTAVPIPITATADGALNVNASLSASNTPGGTLNLLEAGTITRVEGGSIVVTAGTVAVSAGTISAISADLPGGTIDSVTNLAGGTVQLNPKPSTPIITYGTTVGGASATGVTLISAPGSGTSIYLNEISITNQGTAAALIHVGFGTASTAGTSNIVSGYMAANGGGIQKSYPFPVGGHINNLALLGSITAAGTVNVNLSYWVQ